MEHFLVNGVETTSPISGGQRFEELMSYVQKVYTSDSALISSIRVNGTEVTETMQTALAEVPVGDIDQVEVVLSHPRELAEETLQTLLMFTDKLAGLSRKIGAYQSTDTTDFKRLIDGLETL